MLAYNGLMGTEYTPSGTAHFTDTNDPDVNAAYELKIVQGYGDGRFGPNDTLTREQFFKISCNFMQTVGYPTEQNPRVNRYSLSEFSDLKQLAEWAKTPTRLLWLHRRGQGQRRQAPAAVVHQQSGGACDLPALL